MTITHIAMVELKETQQLLSKMAEKNILLQKELQHSRSWNDRFREVAMRDKDKMKQQKVKTEILENKIMRQEEKLKSKQKEAKEWILDFVFVVIANFLITLLLIIVCVYDVKELEGEFLLLVKKY